MTSAPPETSSAATTPATSAPPPAPVWQVGAKPLPLRRDGFGQILPTPPVLANRSLPTADLLPPPAGNRFAGTVNPVPAGVLARSTWQPDCPVTAGELRYLTLSFWGFDGRAHTGEMLVNASVANAVVTVFGRLFAAKFPIEEMRVTAPAELTAPPTGDGNNTTAFVCRPARGLTNWSAHAYGLAIDVDPFCNPYTKGDLVLPELASAYLDRGNRRPGMITAGDPTVAAFAAIGWTWGGSWTTPTDRMHFSSTGR
ncbi:M15 family metallopeptidase [Amycolatopsis japonica]|uniref:M15 family metallopeptidase n=1 Tax=Amycolatopsis japonica TaxID=208439 RepID=UPI0037FC4487